MPEVECHQLNCYFNQDKRCASPHIIRLSNKECLTFGERAALTEKYGNLSDISKPALIELYKPKKKRGRPRKE